MTNVLLAHWFWRRGSRENYNPQSACYRHTFWTDINVRAHSECLYSCLPLKSVPLWMPGVEHLCDVCKFAPQLQYSQIQTTLGKAVFEWTHVNTVLSLNICMIFWGEHWLILNINLTFYVEILFGSFNLEELSKVSPTSQAQLSALPEFTVIKSALLKGFIRKNLKPLQLPSILHKPVNSITYL